MSTIFEQLRDDHDTQRTLLDLLVKTEGDSEGRHELFGRVRTELRAHAAAEEMYFYRPLMKHELTLETSRHSIAEHKQIDDLLETLEATDASSPAWLPAARDLRELVRHHLDEEEQEVFQLAGRALSDADKPRLGAAYREEMEHHKDSAETPG